MCAYVVHERLNGIDATCASANNILTDAEMEELLGKRIVSMSPEEIEKKLLEAGDGAHAVIGETENMVRETDLMLLALKEGLLQ